MDVLGEVDKFVFLKCGIFGIIDELLVFVEYIFSNGNEWIMLCECGICSYEKVYCNIFDINVLVMLKEKIYLLVIVDFSYGIGFCCFVDKIVLVLVVVGVDGIIMEVYYELEKVFSDG